MERMLPSSTSSFALGRSLEVCPTVFAEVGLAYPYPQELEECLASHGLGGKLGTAFLGGKAAPLYCSLRERSAFSD